MSVIRERWENPGGRGNRTSSITVTTPMTLTAPATINNAVDGGFTANTSDAFQISGTVTTGSIKFDFGSGNQKKILSWAWFKNSTTSLGTWKLQGSNDDITYLDITAGVLLNQTANLGVSTGTNDGYYRYYKLVQTAGSTTAGQFTTEIEFRLSDSNNSVDFRSAISPTYSDLQATGDRRAYMTIGGTITWLSGTSTLIDGLFANSATMTNAQSSRYIEFDFFEDVLITELKWYQDVVGTQGTWKWQGLDATSTWIDLGTSFTLGAAATTTVVTAMSAITDYYSKYRLTQVSGTTSSTPKIQEIEFKIGQPALTGTTTTFTSLSPTHGSIEGGTLVTLTGTVFTGSTGVKFDGIAATSVTVVNDTTITCRTPAHAAGTVDVQVFNPTANPTLAASYTYSVVNQTLTLDYGITFSKSLTLDYEIVTHYFQTLTLDYAIALYKTLTLDYQLVNFYSSFYDYRLVDGATVETTSDDSVASATSISSVHVSNTVAPVIIDHYVDEPQASFPVYNFYGDFYLRMWMDPQTLRLSNPRYNAPVSFNLWSAYPTENILSEVIATDLPGVVLGFTTPLTFDPYEFKTLTFSISTDAPAQLDGYFDFILTSGYARLNVIATVVSVLEARPDEPITEKWLWLTTLNISKTSAESRARIRSEPRYQLSFSTTIIDEVERRSRYNQVWMFISRDLQTPLYQYRTPITAPSPAGSNRIYFDPLLTDIRSDEYFVLFNTGSKEIALGIGTVEVDGVTLDISLADDIDDTWWVMPTIAMRMSDGDGLSMDAVTGSAGIQVNSTKKRTLLAAQPSPSLLTMYNDLPVITSKMIAQDSLKDAFEQDVESIDGGAGDIELYTLWATPFLSGSRQWKIDREDPDQINYWREFGAYAKGSQKPFLLPTWREDLTLFEAPVLGSTTIKVEQPGFALQGTHGAYARIQLMSANGPHYKTVTTVEDMGTYTLLTLDDTLGNDPGDDDISMISFLNLCRIVDDTITLTHFVNWTIIEIGIRTIDA